MATPRIPTRGTRFINPEAERMRGMSALEALRGYAGAPSQSSAMYPGSQEAYESGELAGMAEMLIPGAAMAKGALGAALAGVIKPRGGNWIPGDVESSISNPLRPTPSPAYDMYGNEVPNPLANSPMYRDNAVLNRWIEGPLTKYIKRDMATPEDPVRRLADEGILHMGIPQTIEAPSRGIQAARKLAGFPEGGLSITPGGSLWENLSDRVINSGPARYLQEEPKMMAENPWMQKLDPESTVYSMPSSIERGLGLDHLVDELSNSLNPGSGLPRNLLLRPEQMQQMGMEKAVRHVDAINKWRAEQKIAANQELANKALAVREYPDTPELPNPKGLRWVELKTPDEVELPEYKIADQSFTQRGVKIGDEYYEVPYGKEGVTHESVVRGVAGRKELEKQLKYEGEVMGHCVGGYCPDVLKGKSRIFSLRDAKGEPHVTVEVKPAEEWVGRPGAIDENPIIKNEWPEFYRDLVRRVNGNPSPEDIATFKDYMLSKYPDDQSVASFFGPAFKIEQIKGKANKRPKDEYLPFVQDFVRNNPLGARWNEVRDVENTGLRRSTDLWNENERRRIREAGVEIPDYVTGGEMKDINIRVWPDDAAYSGVPKWFADGGVVRAPTNNWRRMELGGTIGYLMGG